MKPSKFLTALGAAAAAAAALLLAGAPVADAAPPTYEPVAGSNGTIAFYDASGNQITSGSITAAPIAAYFVASNELHAGDTQAALLASQPNPSANVQLWNVDTLSSFTNYPLASGPANIQTLSQTHPVVTGQATDLTLNDFVNEFPNTGPSGIGCAYAQTAAGCTNTDYQNLYQLRIKSAGGGIQTTTYAVADVLVSGNTWTQVYPTVGSTPGTPTGVSGTAGYGSAAVSWTAPSDGGSAILGYDVQYSATAGATWVSASSSFHSSPLTTQTVTGLTPGTSYLFRVAAINANGTGSYSAASTAVVPLAPRATALTATAAKSVAYGKAVTVSATLSDKVTHAGIGGKHVTLYDRTSSKAAWKALKTVTTSVSGKASVAVTLHANLQFEYRYAGEAAHLAVTSNVVAVTATQVVAVHASAASITHGKSVKIYGTVLPVGTGQKVSVQELVGKTWKTVGTATIKRQKLPNGKTATGYVVTVKLPKKATYHLRATKAATSTLGAGISATVTVKAK